MSDRIIRIKETCRRTGFTRKHIWQLEKTGRFPKRLKLGPRAVGHLESEVEDWIAQRAAERETDAADGQ